MLLTPGHIRSLCPKALPAYVDNFASEAANALYAEYGFERIELAALMAMASHETGGFTVIRENMNYSAKRIKQVWPKRKEAVRYAHQPRALANCVYNGRMGNRKGSDDGWHFRGAAGLQHTGRTMFEWLERETGLPLASDPQYVEDHPECWPLLAVKTWCKQHFGDLNNFAGQGNFVACCKAINCGSPFSTIEVVGMADRERWYARWCAALDAGKSAAAVPSAPSAPWKPESYRFGAPASDDVRRIQARLNELRYGEGNIACDGLFGDRTRSAVMDFQVKNSLEADGIVGPLTWDKLFSESAVRWPAPAAVEGGVDGLRAAGDPEIKRADRDKAGAVVLGLGAGSKALGDIGAFDGLSDLSRQIGVGKEALTGIVESVKFASGSFLWIAAVVAAYLLWRNYGDTIRARIGKWCDPEPEEQS